LSGWERGIVLLALCGGCLGREQLGDLPTPDGGCQEACVDLDASDQSREAQIARLLRSLAGGWEGTATSGGLQTHVRLDFSLDGRYTLRCAAGREADCSLLFLADQGRVSGSYTINDVLHGRFYGSFYDSGVRLSPESEIGHLTLEGDVLTFERRTIDVNVVLLVLNRAT
jgi:hypothetical protein